MQYVFSSIWEWNFGNLNTLGSKQKTFLTKHSLAWKGIRIIAIFSNICQTWLRKICTCWYNKSFILLTPFMSMKLLQCVTSIYRLHILRYIAGSPIRRHFLRNKCIFKMSIRVPYSPHKLFRFVCCRFEPRGQITRLYVILGSAEEWQNGCGDFISGQNFIKLT